MEKFLLSVSASTLEHDTRVNTLAAWASEHFGDVLVVGISKRRRLEYAFFRGGVKEPIPSKFLILLYPRRPWGSLIVGATLALIWAFLRSLGFERPHAPKRIASFISWAIPFNVIFGGNKLRRVVRTLLRLEIVSGIHIHDLPALVSVHSEVRRSGVGSIYDSHEYWGFRSAHIASFNRWIERLVSEKLIQYATVVQTVSPEIAVAIQSIRQSSDHVPVAVVQNSFFPELKGGKVKVAVSRGATIRIVSVGNVSEARGAERAIQAIGLLNYNYELYFMGRIEAEYRSTLEALIRKLDLSERVHLVAPVQSGHLIEALAKYDLSLITLDNRAKSFEYSLPNKFFESLAAGIPIVASPTDSLAKAIRSAGVGVVADDFSPDAIARAISNASDQRERLKSNVEQNRKMFSALKNKEVFISNLKMIG